MRPNEIQSHRCDAAVWACHGGAALASPPSSTPVISSASCALCASNQTREEGRYPSRARICPNINTPSNPFKFHRDNRSIWLEIQGDAAAQTLDLLTKSHPRAFDGRHSIDRGQCGVSGGRLVKISDTGFWWGPPLLGPGPRARRRADTDSLRARASAAAVAPCSCIDSKRGPQSIDGNDAWSAWLPHSTSCDRHTHSHAFRPPHGANQQDTGRRAKHSPPLARQHRHTRVVLWSQGRARRSSHPRPACAEPRSTTRR